MKQKSLFLGFLLSIASITNLQAGKVWRPIYSLDALSDEDYVQFVMKDGNSGSDYYTLKRQQYSSSTSNYYAAILSDDKSSAMSAGATSDFSFQIKSQGDGSVHIVPASATSLAMALGWTNGTCYKDQYNAMNHNSICVWYFSPSSEKNTNYSWYIDDLGDGAFKLRSGRFSNAGFLGFASNQKTSIGDGYYPTKTFTPSYSEWDACFVNQLAEKKSIMEVRSGVSSTSTNQTFTESARFAGAWMIYKQIDAYTITFDAGEGTINGASTWSTTDAGFAWPNVVAPANKIHVGWKTSGNEDAVALYDNHGYCYPTSNETFIAQYLQMETVTPIFWKENAIILSYLGGATTIETKVCTTDAANPYVGGVYSATTSNLTTSADGVLELNVATGALLANAGKKLVLTFKDGEGNVIGVNALTIPTIITGTKSWSTMSIPSTADVVILNDGTLNVDAAATCHDITISGGAKLVVPVDYSLTANVINMQGGALEGGQYKFRYPQLVANGSITTTDNIINYDYLVNTAQYYSLVLPYDVETADIKYSLTGKNPIFGIQTYDGAKRLDGKSSGWETLVDANNITHTNLTAGTGYTFFGVPAVVKLPSGERVRKNYDLFRFPMTVDLTSGETADNGKRTIAVAPYGKDDANVKPNDKGWNLVGNPYLATINGVDGLTSNGIGLLEDDGDGYSWTGNVRYVVIPKDNGLDYDQREAANTPLPAFKNFFVQIGNGDALEFTLAKRAQSAPARMLEAQPAHSEVMTGIVLSSATQSDKMGMLIGEGFTDAYEINADLQKWMNSKLNIYAVSAAAGGNLAYIAIDPVAASNNIKVGFTAPTTGNYTICMDKESYANTDIQALYLTDTQTGTVTNLLYNDYTFASNKGTFNTRFLLACQLTVRTTPTDLQTISKNKIFATSDNGILNLHRLPIDARIIITNMAGQLIQEATATKETMTLAIPQGLYTVRVVGDEGVQTIQTIVR